MENLKLQKLSTADLRDLWRGLWKLDPPDRMGRTMMMKSIEYKQREQDGAGLTAEQKTQLDKLVKQYQRDPKAFDQGRILKAGTKLVRHYSGQKHIVTVLKDGFEYQEQQWSSLSKIAAEITGTAWNGWRFFGI
jgi:hypothetical protein